jgi:arylsulfatase A-like enzyme
MKPFIIFFAALIVLCGQSGADPDGAICVSEWFFESRCLQGHAEGGTATGRTFKAAGYMTSAIGKWG